jgi:hypothetical protein
MSVLKEGKSLLDSRASNAKFGHYVIAAEGQVNQSAVSNINRQNFSGETARHPVKSSDVIPHENI